MTPIFSLPFIRPKRGPIKRIFIRWQFEPRDVWLGGHWDFFKECEAWGPLLNLYICILPLLPLFVQIELHKRGDDSCSK